MMQSLAAVQAWLVARLEREEGATMVEYGLMLALIAVVCIGAITLLGNNTNDLFTDIANAL